MFEGDNTVLVIGAHPDDEVLGAGGTIAKHANSGDDVHILIVTEGTTHQYGDTELIEEKKKQAKLCADTLGASTVHFGDLPDMKLDQIPHVEVNSVIEGVCCEVNPDIVYTHSRREVNLDHLAVHESTVVATRPGSGVSTVLTYETPSSTDFATDIDGFNPTLFTEIEEYLDVKTDAFNCYETEVREYPHPRSTESIRSIAKARGAASGCRAAEAFDILRAYR
ncbi:PIG-L deacetylase family protein [Halorubrum tibetense]|uniref:PIG-L deacetylase family protein n=1 Tax=Halorubrum tibetense TaxID=175631 RepID=A0ABD5S883_9EURY